MACMVTKYTVKAELIVGPATDSVAQYGPTFTE